MFFFYKSRTVTNIQYYIVPVKKYNIRMKHLLTLFLIQLIISPLFAGVLTVKLNDSQSGFSLYRSNEKIVQLDSLKFNFLAAEKVTVVSSSASEIKLEFAFNYLNPNKVNTYSVRKVPLIISIKDDVVHLQATAKWSNCTSLYLKDLGGDVYGIQQTLYPENNKTPRLNGATMDVEVNGEAYRFHENYASVSSAFYFNSLGYASFFDSFATGRYWFSQNGKTTIQHNTGSLDWYIFTGNYKQIYSDYYSVIGAPKYVPAWACGPIVWRDENKNSAEILDDVKQFSDLKIPFTAIFVDRPYSNGTHGWSAMDFSSEFDNPTDWIAELNNKYGVEFMSWVASATFGDTIFPGLLPGFFGYIDLSNAEGVNEFGRRLTANQYANGVKGHKLDRADEHFPVSEPWADETPVFERRNKYPYLYAKVTDSLLNSFWGLNNVNFARASFHRSQPYLTAVWGGDVRTSWDGLASNIANAMRCGFMGFSNWGSDVGGYLGEGYIPEDLYARWLQFGCWTGFYEVKLDGSGGSGRERTPWQYSESFQQLYADIFTQRMQMLPYIFSMLNSADINGPLMKPMSMVYPSDKRFANCWDQYLFGNDFLVAPIYTSSSKRKVSLPEGNWIDFYSGEIHHGDQTIVVEKSLLECPVFIKEGALFVKGSIIAGNSTLWQKAEHNVDIYYVPGKDGTFDFVDDQSSVRFNISAKQMEVGKCLLSIPAHTLFGKLVVLSTSKVKTVKLNGRKTNFKQSNGVIEILFDNSLASQIELVLE